MHERLLTAFSRCLRSIADGKFFYATLAKIPQLCFVCVSSDILFRIHESNIVACACNSCDCSIVHFIYEIMIPISLGALIYIQ